MTTQLFYTRTEEETIALGRRFAAILSRGLVFLTGNLGAGKTTLIKGIVEGCGAATAEEISSPTFALIHEYGTPTAVYHVDLYRLDTERQLASLGLEEIIAGDKLVLVEWGQKFRELLPEPLAEILITRESSSSNDPNLEDDRRIELRVGG